MEDSETTFSCRSGQGDIHTHAPASNLLYNLGLNATTGLPNATLLKPLAASRWKVWSQAKVQEKLAGDKTGKGKRSRTKKQ